MGPFQKMSHSMHCVISAHRVEDFKRVLRSGQFGISHRLSGDGLQGRYKDPRFLHPHQGIMRALYHKQGGRIFRDMTEW